MLKLLKKLNKKQVLFIFICIIFIVAQVFLDLRLPDYMQDITTLLQTPTTEVKDILKPGSYMLLCALGSLISAFITGYFASYVANSFSKNLRKEVFTKVENLDVEEVKNFSTSSLITRTTNDVNQVQMLLSMGIQLMIKAPIMALWAILKIVNKNYTWTIITGGAVIALLVMIITLVIFALPKFKIIQKLTDNLNKTSRENLIGLRVVHAYNANSYQEEKFSKANDELTKTTVFAQKIMAIMEPGMSLIMSLLTLAIYFVGAYLINEASLADKALLFSNMVVFSSYASLVVMSFMMLSMIFIIYPRASVSAKRIVEVLETKQSIKNGTVTKTDPKNKGTLEFKNVSFRYPDAKEDMLTDISFKVKKGETIAVIGGTGSGKSTLINLIPRFYDATSGMVLVDGVDVKEYDTSYLNSKIGYISQKAVMFKGTVNSNVSYGLVNGKKPSFADVKKAIKIAQAEDFVLEKEDSYDSFVARGGTNVSGGQKQRLSIARAIARNPEIYIFDDTFSALDYKTDLTLRKELKNHIKDATCIIVAQRIGTIKDADQIIVLNDGKCVGIGKHQDLLKTCQVYKEIALSQLGEEELKNV